MIGHNNLINLCKHKPFSWTAVSYRYLCTADMGEGIWIFVAVAVHSMVIFTVSWDSRTYTNLNSQQILNKKCKGTLWKRKP